jgi:DNA-binding SARP family transcriptional activator
MVRYAILGPVELWEVERRIGVGGTRQVALLALLLVNANRAVSTDRLIEALWGDLRRTGAVKRLRVAITRLRRTLDPDRAQDESVLRTVPGGYLLAVAPGELDAEVFARRLAEGREALQVGEAARARDLLAEALGLWRGPTLAEVAYEEFAQPEIRRLEELRLAALEARVDCELQFGQHGGVIAELEALVAAHPGRERLVGQLMLALYRCGRQGEALDVYARTRAYLSGELGLQPGPALQALQADVLAQSSALFTEPGAVTGRSAGSSHVVAAPAVLALPRSLQPPLDSPFVGRQAEVAALRRHWTQVRGWARSVVVIGGDAGIGKTRLASEVAEHVHERGALVLYGRSDDGLAVPYQPFIEALRPYARSIGLERLRTQLGDLAPHLGPLLPELPGLGQPVHGDPESERFTLFEAVAALIEAMTRQQKVLLVIDDLHWAPKPTLLLLRHLIRSERPLGALILGTYRETEVEPGQPLAHLLADLHRDPGIERLSIRGLDEPAIATLLQATVGPGLDELAKLAHLLVTQTGGNPFFLRELLAPVPDARERLRQSVTAAQFEVPVGLRQVIDHRVARLSGSAKRALSVAAVAGTTFSFLLLERVLGEEPDVLDALDEAVAAGLLSQAEHGNYAFTHALVRQTIYAQLGAARQMRLHRQLGEAIEALGHTQTHAEDLAYHRARAATRSRAAEAAAA